jgi:YfiH family protein
MPYHHVDSIRYYTFELLNHPGITHAVFTRRGGLSPAPWASLNVGAVVGDEINRVVANRERAFRAVRRDPSSIFDVWQVHSAEVVCTDAPRKLDTPYVKADAILTQNPEVTLFMRFADCVPILFLDPIRKVIGLAHAGWLGTIKGVAPTTVKKMVSQYECKPGDILACIGPSIGPHHYPVGPEVVSQVENVFGDFAPRLLPEENGAVQFDLWEANHWQLEQAGVRQIEVSSICTACEPDNWYSHRGENGKTGRFGALIGLI